MRVTRVPYERPALPTMDVAFHHGHTTRSPYWSQQADRVFYVTVLRAERHAALLGPYDTHQEALDNVDRANKLACAADPRCDFDAFGTCSAPRDQVKRTAFGR